MVQLQHGLVPSMYHIGLPIYVTTNALKETDERLFPESKHRSKRIRKKLIKRFGSEFRRVPAIWKTPSAIIMHPAHYAAFKAALANPPTPDRSE